MEQCKNKIIFHKEYNHESTYDLSRDVEECFNEDYNNELLGIPKDEYGFIKGKFTVSILWEEVELLEEDEEQ